MKQIFGLLWGLAVAGAATAGIAPPYGWTSEPMTLDIESGVRQTAGVESLAYDAAWVAEATNGVTFKVSVNGAEKAQVGAYGVLDWQEKRPGSYTVTAQAYQGGALVGELLSATFVVAGHDLVNAEVTVDTANVIYDGTAKCPAVVVRLSDKTLTEGVDYDLSYENNVAAGVGKVVITGMGKYVDEIERPFTIRPACCCPLDVQSGSRQTTGTEMLAVDPSWLGELGSTVWIAANGSSVGETNKPGTVAWSPIAPGEYTLTYSTYTGGVLQPETYTATFRVAGESVPFEIELDAVVYPYQGEAVVPKVNVTYHGVPLVEGKDYTLTLYNNDAVGVGRMVIAGKGAYSGTVEKSFYILASAKCTLDINDGIRIATGDETIRYSNVWSGDASSTARVTVKDVTAVEEQGTGDWVWTPGGVGLYEFKHTTMTGGVAGEVLAAQFYVPGTMTDATVSLAFTECLYDGSAACPKVVVTQGGKTLVEGLDYTVTYALNDRPGTGVAIVRGARGETYEATFTIRPAGCCFLNIESGIRDADAEEHLAYDTLWQGVTNAAYRIAVNGAELASGTGTGETLWTPQAVGAYTLTYQAFANNAKIGETWTASFRIAGKDLVNATITLPSDEVLYDGTALQPKPTIVYLGETLVEGVDYTLEYANNVDAGVATMTIHGAGRFVDVIEKTFVIRPAGVCSLDVESGAREAAAVELLNYDMAWDGATTAKIAVNGADLATVSGVGETAWRPTAAGDYTVTYRSYKGSAKTDTEWSAKFHITGQDLVNATITLDNEHILYDGTPREPKATIVYGGKTLAEGVDYALSYANNVSSGVATMTITGMGDYHDVLERSFTIIPAGVCFLDIESGVREAKKRETLTYDWVWHGDAVTNTEMKILVQKSDAAYAATLASGLSDIGVQPWQPADKGQYTVMLRTYVDGYYLDSLDETAVFNAESQEEPFPEGAISVTGYEGKYDGNGHSISVTTTGISSPTITYSRTAAGPFEATNPSFTNVCDETVWCVIAAEGYITQTNSAKVVITKGSVGPGGGEEPGGGEVPPGGVSKFDATAMYDGDGHTIDTNALKAAFAGSMVGEFEIAYAVGGDVLGAPQSGLPGGQPLPWRNVPPVWTNVVATSLWYKVTSPNYNDFVHEAKVTITNRPIALASVAPIADQTYTGAAIEPVPTVTDKRTLIGALSPTDIITTDDYAVSYADNIDVGTAKVILTGQNNYAGVVTNTFQIVPAVIPPGPTGAITATGYTNAYDGVAHGVTVTVTGLKTTPTVQYRSSPTAEWQSASPTYADVCDTQVWWKVSAPNYSDATGTIGVKITPRPVTLTSGTKTDFMYDGTPHEFSVMIISENSFAAGEGVTTSNWATVTAVTEGQVDNTFDYAPLAGTKLSNYDISVVTGKIAVVKGTIPPEDDPGKVDPSVDPTDPEQVKDPTIKFSPWDYVGVYDGAEHTVDTNAMKAAYVAVMGEGVTVQYAAGGGAPALPWDAVAPTFKDVVATSFWYKVSAANYNDIIHPCKVIITNRPVTVTSRDISKTFDGTPLKVTEGDITVTLGGPTSWAAADGQELVPPGESFVYGDFGERTAVGTSPASFSVSAGPNTKLSNYDIHCVTGTITITKGTLDPEDDPGEPDPSVDPTDPEQVKDPTIRFSPWDYVGMYDGAEHTVDTNAMKAAYADKFAGNIPSFAFATASNGTYGVDAPTFRDVVATSFWYKVSAANYNDIIHPCKVIVTNRCVTMKSADGTWVYDGKEHSTNAVTVTIHGDDGAAGVRTLPGGLVPLIGDETVQTTFYKVCSEVGVVSNDFSIAWTGTAKEVNYNVTLVTGKLEIVAAGAVTVTITGRVSNVVYDGTEKSVSGYDIVSISDSHYKATDFRFDGVAAANGTNAGKYPMGLKTSDFVNTNDNFSVVTFNVTDGWLKIEKGSVDPGGGEEPGGGEVPPGGVSKFDVTAMYDGDGHTIDTNALVAAFKTSVVGGFEIAYSVGGPTSWAAADGQEPVPPVWTNVVATSLWYKVTSPNYNDFVHEAKVTITNRAIALASVGTIADQTYTGAAIEPVPTVTDLRTLIGATVPTDIITADDYAVSYADNIDVGTAKVILTGQNNYAGVVTNTFQIVPAIIPPGPSGAITATGYTNVYDGVAHGVTVTATGLVTTPTVQYRSSPTAEWQSASPAYKDVCDTQVWWKVSAPNYSNATGTIGVKITPRPVTLTSGTKTDFVYDGTPHEFSVMIISENPFAAGEGVATLNWATVTTVAEGQVDNTFDYAPLEGTKLDNYDISVVTGKIAVVKGTIPPGSDPGEPDPSVDPSDPEQVKDPTIRFSPWDYVGVYDGAEHTVDTNEMKAAYVAVMGEGVTVQYAAGGGAPALPWVSSAPTFKDVVATSFWYKVSAANYEDVIHPCKVIITNRPVTVTSRDISKTFDGTPLKVTAEDITVTLGGPTSWAAADGQEPVPPGESFVYGDFGERTEVGTSPASFSVSAGPNTKLGNYDIHCVTGTITITEVGAVTVTITGHVSNVTYDGTEKSVSGYDIVSISDPLYKATDFKFTGSAATNGTDAGTYPMGLASSQFANTNGNFSAVTFKVTDGSLIIAKANHDMTGVAWNYGAPFTYDGLEKSVALTTCPATLTPSYTDNAKTAAGIYMAKVSFTYDTKNYNAPSAVADCAWEIKKGTVGPGDDPGKVDPSVDPTDPEQVKDPTIRFSPWDYVGVYDGATHTVDTNAMKAAYVAVMGEGVTVGFMDDASGAAGVRALPPTFVDVVATSFWYKVSAANYEDVIHPCKVIITNRPVTATSRDISKTFDGTPLKVTAEDITVTLGGPTSWAAADGQEPVPPGESFVYGDFGERTAVGTSPASFSVSAGPNTKLGNYDIHCVTGTITITAVGAVTVTITGHVSNVTYDGTEKSVSGYDIVSISDSHYKATDFRFDGVAAANGTNAGKYPMGLKTSDFVNTNDNFSVVTFNVTDGWLEIEKGAVGPGGGEEPGGGEVPSGGVSKFDATAMYDGDGHTIDTNALKAAFAGSMVGEFEIAYAVGGDALGAPQSGLPGGQSIPWRNVPPVWTNVVTTSLWYKVTSPNYNDFVHEAKVTITNRPIAMASVAAIADQTYTGAAIEPVPTVTDQRTLIGATSPTDIITADDYTVSYADNVNVGTAKVILTGRNNYAGVVTNTFQIVPAVIPPGPTGAITATGYTNAYDGAAHGVTVTATGLATTPTVQYRNSSTAEWQSASPTYKDVCDTQVWWKVSAPNYSNATGTIGVKITPRPVTLTSGTKTDFVYDGTPHEFSVMIISENPFATGEGVVTSNWATVTTVAEGQVDNMFDYAPLAGTKLENYDISVVTGKIAVVKGALDPEDDPGKVDPSVDPTDPEQVKDPTIRFSPWDYVGVYDGATHTVDTNAMKAAYVAVMGEGVTVGFMDDASGAAGVRALPPTFKDVVATSFWYKVSAVNYEDVIHPCKVIVTNRPVTVTSRDISKTFDGTPLKVTEGDITVTLGGPTSWAAADGQEPVPPGESFVYGDFGERTAVGTSPAAFSVSAGPNTKLGNYDIHCVTGTITITKGTLDPGRDPGEPDPSVDPTDPEQVKDPTIRFSPWDYVGMYDGAAHTVDTNAMKAAYVAVMGEGVTVGFMDDASGAAGVRALPPTFKDVVATSFWYKVSAVNYEDVIHPCKVIVTNRPVTVTSRDISKTFDGTPLKVTEEDITVTLGGPTSWAAADGQEPVPPVSADGQEPVPPGESFVYGDFGERTEVGTSPASFSVSAGPNTKLGNYDIHCVTGTITILPPVTTTMVVFDAIGGKIGIRSVVTQEWATVYGTLPTATRANYLFRGWFLGVTNGAPQAVAGGAFLKAGDHTLFAKWTVDPAVTPDPETIYKWVAIDANTARITGFKKANQQIARMIIPETIGGRFVTEIASLAFSNAKCGATELALPTFLTTVGDKAFMSLKTTANAYSLKKITFVPVRRWDDPTLAGALTIGAYSFSSETPLKELTLPAEVASIGNYAFANCRQMSSITILGKPAIGTTIFRNAGVDVGGVTVHIDPALAGDAAYMAQIKGGLANVTVKTDAVVTGIETAGLTMGASGKVTLTLGVARAAAWGKVDTSAVKVEYRATLDAAPTTLAPKATENADGTVTVEVAVPQGESGFLRVEME